jgi:hypothetical protein
MVGLVYGDQHVPGELVLVHFASTDLVGNGCEIQATLHRIARRRAELRLCDAPCGEEANRAQQRVDLRQGHFAARGRGSADRRWHGRYCAFRAVKQWPRTAQAHLSAAVGAPAWVPQGRAEALWRRAVTSARRTAVPLVIAPAERRIRRTFPVPLLRCAARSAAFIVCGCSGACDEASHSYSAGRACT